MCVRKGETPAMIRWLSLRVVPCPRVCVAKKKTYVETVEHAGSVAAESVCRFVLDEMDSRQGGRQHREPGQNGGESRGTDEHLPITKLNDRGESTLTRVLFLAHQ